MEAHATMPAIPGYGGYRRPFENQYVTSKSNLAFANDSDIHHKYDKMSSANQTKKLSDDQTKSLYQATHNDLSTIENLPKAEEMKYSLKIKDNTVYSPLSKASDEWKTTYSSTHIDSVELIKQEMEKIKMLEKQRRSSNSLKREQEKQEKIQQQILQNEQTQLFRESYPPNAIKITPCRVATAQQTGYQIDYGIMGTKPIDRIDQKNEQNIDVKDLFSQSATTKDLFMGSIKSSEGHIPGYRGHIPSSEITLKTMKLEQKTNVKDNLIENFRHNMPGYSGFKPKSVVNDRGPRNPSSKGGLRIGSSTGLILSSMKTE